MEQTAIDTPIRAYLTDYCRRTGRSLSGLARDAGYTPESLRAAMRAGRCSYRLSEALSEASGGELVPAVLAGLEAPWRDEQPMLDAPARAGAATTRNGRG